MTYRELLTQGENLLRLNGISDYKTDAFLLLENVFSIRRTDFLLNPFAVIDNTEKCEEYIEKINLRGKHIPLQHITHEQEFMGIKFYVDENVLIPRQDTEILVETAIKMIEKLDGKSENSREASEALKKSGRRLKILDMCTGSGCIAASIAKLCENTAVTAVDLSKKALDIADKNAKANDVSINFLKSDLFTSINDEKFDIIVSNPPYIKTKVIDELEEEVKFHEPLMALDGSEDGLSFYRGITREAPKYLNDGGYLIYEIGFDQGLEVKALMENAGFDEIEIIKDLAGLDRVVKGRKTGGNIDV